MEMNGHDHKKFLFYKGLSFQLNSEVHVISIRFCVKAITFSTTLRTFSRKSSESVFYSTARLLSHQQSGLHFVLPAKYKYLHIVAGRVVAK